jgi:hypothetical protein
MSVPKAIFIDTSILEEQNYNFSSGSMSAFLEATKDQKMILLLPDPTRREIHRHIEERSEEVIKALEEAKRRAPFLSKWEEWPFNRRDLSLVFKLRQIANKEWNEFLTHFKLEDLGYDGVNLLDVMNWYDQKRAPFGGGKKRKEFPDAFALAALLSYAKKNDISIAVVCKDKDFEGACCFYSELLYFRSLPGLTEALLSADKRVAEVKKVIESNPILIVKKIKEEFGDRWFCHEDDYGADVEDIEVDDVTINDIRVIHIGENEVTIAFEANVDYSAYVRMDDHDTASVDSSEDFYMVLQEYRGTVQDCTEVSGIAKCFMSADWKMVQKVVTFQIQEDHITVTQRPEETYWKGEE